MLVLELYAGTRSIGKAFERKGHKVLSIDYDEQFENVVHMDVADLTPAFIEEQLGGMPDVIWASPDCTTYSIAGISHHRTKNIYNGQLDPVSDYAHVCDNLNYRLLSLVNHYSTLNGTMFFIENPRGGMRKMHFVESYIRHTVTYCQYGDKRMKPTDIWSNMNIPFKPMCKNGDPCHVSAPRGSTTGTQGMSKIDKSRIPSDLCDFIVEFCEEVL